MPCRRYKRSLEEVIPNKPSFPRRLLNLQWPFRADSFKVEANKECIKKAARDLMINPNRELTVSLSVQI